MTIDLPYPVRITIEEHTHDGNCTPACHPVFEFDAGATVGACPADKAVADFALDLAYIDPRIKRCDQARVRVGAEFLLREGENKEEAVEALRNIFRVVAYYTDVYGSLRDVLRKAILKRR